MFLIKIKTYNKLDIFQFSQTIGQQTLMQPPLHFCFKYII